MGKKTPKQPNPADTVKMQADANQISQYTPYGNLQYGSVDESGNFVAKTGGTALQTTETDFQKQQRLAKEGIAAGLTSQYSPNDKIVTPWNNYSAKQIESRLGQFGDPTALKTGIQDFYNINRSGLPEVMNDYSADADKVTAATFQRQAGLLAPQFELQTRREEQRLADQGLPMGSEAYTTERDRTARGQNEAYNAAALDAVLAGRQEQGRLANLDLARRGQLFGEESTVAQQTAAQRGQAFGENTTQFQAQNQLRQQQLAEQLALREMQDRTRASQLNERSMISGGMPMQVQPQNTQGVDVAGIYNQAFQNQLGVNAQKNQALGGLLQLGGTLGAASLMGPAGAAGIFSDKRLKDGIVKVGEKNGINIYEFNYKGDDRRFRGVMAQEVSHIDGATEIGEDGYLRVNYDVIGIPFEEVTNGQ